jgi:hypothetical protein
LILFETPIKKGDYGALDIFRPDASRRRNAFRRLN